MASLEDGFQGTTRFAEVPTPDAAKFSSTPFRVVPVPLGEGEDEQARVVQRGDTFEDPQLVDVASGVKVWEGGVDLARYLATLPEEEARCFDGCRVLELGAGHGLPGLTAACRWRRATVHYHDMSEEVLREVTILNLVANGAAGLPLACATGGVRKDYGCCEPRFLAGDWQQLHNALGALGLEYDVVLAADVIYKTDFYGDLAALLERCLVRRRPADSPPSLRATAYFVGKRFYFGCGGGTASFAAFLREHGFDVEVVRTIEDGRSNVREVLAVRRPGDDEAGRRLAPTSSTVSESEAGLGKCCGERETSAGDADLPPVKRAREGVGEHEHAG